MTKDKYWYLQMNEQIDEAIKATLDDVVLDSEGIPTAVGPSTTRDAMLMSFIVTAGELAEVGLVASDVPRLTVI